MKDLGQRLSEARERRRRPMSGLFGLGGAPAGPPSRLARRAGLGIAAGIVVALLCRYGRGYSWAMAVFTGAAVGVLVTTGLSTVRHLIDLHRS